MNSRPPVFLRPLFFPAGMPAAVGFRSLADRISSAAILLLILLAVWPPVCAAMGAGGQPAPGFETLTLKRRNWENHGTDTIIESDGRFTVTAVFLGRTKPVRQGRLSAEELAALERRIRAAEPSLWPAEYQAPFKTPNRWWGYEIILAAGGTVRTVRFHSEDDQVPAALRELVETITGLSR